MDDDERSYASIGSAVSGTDASALPRKDPTVDYMRLEAHHCRGPELLGSTRLVCHRVLDKCRKKGHRDLEAEGRYPIGCYRVLRGKKNTKLFRGFLADTLLSPEEEEAMEAERTRTNQEAYKQHQATLAMGAVNLSDDPRADSSDHTSARYTLGDEPEELYSDFAKELEGTYSPDEAPEGTLTTKGQITTGAAYEHSAPKVVEGKVPVNDDKVPPTRDELVEELHRLRREMADLRKGRTVHSQATKKAPALGALPPQPTPRLSPDGPICPYFQTNRIFPTRFYVVMKGRVPSDNGIYHSWTIAGKKVTQVSGALHQSFKTYREAFEYWWQGTQELIAEGALPGRVPQPPPVGVDHGPGGHWLPCASGGWKFSPPSSQVPPARAGGPGLHLPGNPPPSSRLPSQQPPSSSHFLPSQPSPSLPPGGQETQPSGSGGGYPHPPPSNYLGVGTGLEHPSIAPPMNPTLHQVPWGQASTSGHLPTHQQLLPTQPPPPNHYGLPYTTSGHPLPRQASPAYPQVGWGPPPHAYHSGAPAPNGTLTTRFRGPDSSSGREGEVFGVKAQEEHAMLEAFAPGLSYEAQNRIALQMLDAVGLPGTSTTTSEEHSISRLAEGLQTLATGRLSSPLMGQLGSTMDTGWKQTTRNTIGKLKTQNSLQEQVLTLTSSKEEVLSNVLTNIGLAYVAVGYPHDLAQTYARESMFYRMSRENLEGYLHLHLHLLTRSVELGFAEVKAELEYHSKKLLDIRALQPTRFKMIVHHYIYFRDGQKKRWHSFGLQDLYMRSMRALHQGGGEETPTPGGGGRPCGHCQSRLHKGGKSKCYWKELTPNEARKAAASTAQNLGTSIVGVDE